MRFFQFIGALLLSVIGIFAITVFTNYFRLGEGSTLISQIINMLILPSYLAVIYIAVKITGVAKKTPPPPKYVSEIEKKLDDSGVETERDLL